MKSTHVFHFTRLKFKLIIIYYCWFDIYNLKRMESFLSAYLALLKRDNESPIHFGHVSFWASAWSSNKQISREEKSFTFECAMTIDTYSVCTQCTIHSINRYLITQFRQTFYFPSINVNILNNSTEKKNHKSND